MIDLDLLDEQLEQALTEDVRALRGAPPRRATPPPLPSSAAPARSDWTSPSRATRPAPEPEPEPDGLGWVEPEWTAPSVAPRENDWADEFEWGAPTAPAAPAPPTAAKAQVQEKTAPPRERPRPAATPPEEPAPARERPRPEATAPEKPAPPRERPRPAAPASRPRPAPARPASRVAAFEPFEDHFDEPAGDVFEGRAKPASARSSERPTTRASARSSAGPFDRPTERPTTRASERPFDRSTTRASERPSERPFEQTRSQGRQGPAGTPLERLREAAAALTGPDGKPRDLAIAEHARAIPDLVARGEMASVDQHIAEHARLTAERGTTEDRADGAAWEAMRSLLDGRRDEARDGVDAVRRLSERARGPQSDERTWTLRFWVGMEWGSDAEQFVLLDHSRERAYRYNDLPWRAALAVQLARLGRLDEAGREFDAVAPHGKALAKDATALDILTNLAEAAFHLRDGRRAALVDELILGAKASLVTVGPAWVCKGSVARFAAHVAAARGRWDDADRYFAAALKTHRRLHAEPLVARTLYEWGTSLRGRNDDLARQYLDESAELAARLRLNGIAPVNA